MTKEAMNWNNTVGGKKAERIPCPDGVEGCLVAHYKVIEEQTKQEQDEPETLNYTVSVECKRCGSHEKYDLEVDYPPPQQRTWIGLLEDEKEHIEISGGKADLTLAEKIEAILKERNT